MMVDGMNGGECVPGTHPNPGYSPGFPETFTFHLSSHMDLSLLQAVGEFLASPDQDTYANALAQIDRYLARWTP